MRYIIFGALALLAAVGMACAPLTGTPTLVPGATAIPIPAATTVQEPPPSPTATPTSESTPTPVPKPTATTAPTSTPRPTPSPSPYQQIASSLPWTQDSLSPDERKALNALSELIANDPFLATAVASLPWVVNGGITEGERKALQNLASLTSQNVLAGKKVASLTWFIDGLTESEQNALMWVMYLAEADVTLAHQVTGMPFFATSI
jgi:hypothetical protein